MALLNTNIGPERVQVFDVPVGVVQIPGAATSVTAFLISSDFIDAPVNTPVAIRSLDQFVGLFGGPENIAHDAYYAVQGYYDNAGTGAPAIIVNVGEDASAADFIGDAAASSGLRALDAVDTLGLVCIPGLPLEMAALVHPALIDYSETVRAEFGSTLSTTFSLLSIPKEISKAELDSTLMSTTFQAVTGSGPYIVTLGAADIAASGTVTITNFANLIDDDADTIEVAGVIFTAQAGAATPGDATFQASSSNDATALSLAAQINAHAVTSDLVQAVANAAMVTITAVVPGEAGNSLTLDYSDEDSNGTSVGATVSGTGTLTNGQSFDIDLSDVTSGMLLTNASGSFKSAILEVNDSTDQVTILTNPSDFILNDVVLIKIPSAISYKDIIVNNPSRLAAWYFNNVVVLDRSEEPAAPVLAVDPVGHVAGIIGRIDSNIAIGGPSHAPAGIRYAGIAGISGLSLTLSERLDGGPLRLAFINRLQAFPGSGNVVFGGYTAGGGAVTADEQLIQVMRTLQYVKASLEPGLRPWIWENFSPNAQGEIERAILSFLRNNVHLFPAGLPESAQFQVISVEPTQDELDLGLLRVRVLLRPNKAIKFVEVALEYPIPTQA